MNEELSHELDELLLAHQEGGGLDDAQRERFEFILKSYPEARTQFVQQQLLDAALHLEQSAGLDVGAVELPATRAIPRVKNYRWIGIAASILIALGAGLGLGLLLSDESAPNAAENAPGLTDSSVAVLARALDVKWSGDQSLASGSSLPPGPIAIDRGLIQIEFYSGARLIVEGPAEIELVSSNEAICKHGKLRAFVPEHAHGFTVHSPKFELVDLGTEFGMEVTADGDSEVQVFDGEVELYAPAEIGLPRIRGAFKVGLGFPGPMRRLSRSLRSLKPTLPLMRFGFSPRRPPEIDWRRGGIGIIRWRPIPESWLTTISKAAESD